MKKSCFWMALLLAGILGIHNGYLCLWSEETSHSVRIFPYPSQIFPQADQAALEKGISFSNRMELSSLLEDFMS